ILNLFSTYFRDKIFNFKILEDLFKKNYLDFLAINYYTKQNIRFGGLLGKECNSYLHNERKNFLGWYVYPDGLFNLLIKLKKFNLPIIITENGTAETQDILYKDYLLLHLKSVHKAILKKVNVKGYLWWSLIDNFEWDKGFGPRFGLIEVNYKTFERKIKPFALVYAKIAKENKIVLNGA
ncbi:MAG: family 1 glycosylhydrolase, partial [Candidatus Aenigmatarchaeota archaeon]